MSILQQGCWPFADSVLCQPLTYKIEGHEFIPAAIQLNGHQGLSTLDPFFQLL